MRQLYPYVANESTLCRFKKAKKWRTKKLDGRAKMIFCLLYLKVLFFVVLVVAAVLASQFFVRLPWPSARHRLGEAVVPYV